MLILKKKSKGRIVNVPTNVESSLQMLPRRYNDLGVIMVKLKKRLSFKSSVWQETIRVDAIKRAAKFLQNSQVLKIFMLIFMILRILLMKLRII